MTVAAFLGAHPPFDALDDAELAALASVAEPEWHRSGAVVLAEGVGPPAHVRVVQEGGVEIVLGGRVLDLLGPGELFGHAAMLAGLPLGFSAVARGATTCLRLPAGSVRTLLGRPDGLRYVARSYEAWERAARGWLRDPTQEKAPILVSLVVDARPVWGVRVSPAIPDVFRDARRHPDLLRLLGRYALAHRPPTGFLRDFVVEHSGRHRGRLDLKRGGLVSIVDLARWAGMTAGVTSGSTPARLRAAAAAGTLDADAAATCEEAFHLVLQLRLTHQVEQLRAGSPPDDLVAPRDLSAVTRASLREAFRAVAAVQRRISAELELGMR